MLYQDVKKYVECNVESLFSRYIVLPLYCVTRRNNKIQSFTFCYEL